MSRSVTFFCDNSAQTKYITLSITCGMFLEEHVRCNCTPDTVEDVAAHPKSLVNVASQDRPADQNFRHEVSLFLGNRSARQA